MAQEKTGGFWVNGKLFGRQTCHPAEDVEHSDFVLFIGTNPWQSHGFGRARKVLNEIAADPDRTMVVVDSSNPILTAADTRAYRDAFRKLDLLVVIDVAMTETARLADYVLPVPTQFEKLEATFFNFEYPTNFFHLRRPVLEQPANTLTEPEIYRRLAVAMGELPESFPILRTVARLDRAMPRARLFPLALKAALTLRPRLRRFLPTVLRETLGRALPGGAESAAVLWGACQFFARKHAAAVRRAGIEDGGGGRGPRAHHR